MVNQFRDSSGGECGEPQAHCPQRRHLRHNGDTDGTDCLPVSWAQSDCPPRKEQARPEQNRGSRSRYGCHIRRCVITTGKRGPHTPVSYTHLRAHETVLDLVCRLLLEKKKKKNKKNNSTI